MTTGEKGAPIRVLVIENDRAVADFVRIGLTFEGYTVYVAANRMDGLRQAEEFQPHLVILDGTLPGLGGVERCLRQRLAGDVPVLMLAPRDGAGERVRGPGSGAGEYLTKPFDFDELAAHVRALLRRAQGQDGQVLQVGDLRLDLATREVDRGGTPLRLTGREFDLLAYFMRRPRQVLSRETLLAGVWGRDSGSAANVVEVYVGYLRDKLGDRPPRRIGTVRGVGYVLRG